MLEAFGKTDVGRRRKLNEDNFLVDTETSLFAVCDGMGGHNAGEVASKMAIETLQAFIAKSQGEEKDITWPYGLEPTLSFEANRLKTAIKLANKRVFKAADNREDYTGMGTTLVAALVNGTTLTVGGAGDSRCYLFRDGALTQITRDDSWVSAAWAEGILSSDEIERHPLRNVATFTCSAPTASTPCSRTSRSCRRSRRSPLPSRKRPRASSTPPTTPAARTTSRSSSCA
jgi:protein phosphatase